MPTNSRQLLKPEHRAYVVERYLANTPPRELAAELAEKFGVVVPSSKLRQMLTRSGVGKRRKEIDAKTCAIVSSAAVNRIAQARAAEPQKHLEAWADRTVGITDRALTMAESASKPRDLASAVNAASTSIRTFRACMGLDREAGGATTNLMASFWGAPLPPRISVKVGNTEIAVTAGTPEAKPVDAEV